MNSVLNWLPRPDQRRVFAGLSLSAIGLMLGLVAGACSRDEGKASSPQGKAPDVAKGENLNPVANLFVAQKNALRSQVGVNINTEYKGGRLHTNQWGMRDKDYALATPPATRRIAILGPAHVFGAGVNDAETFEQIVEDRLNREVSPRAGLKFEFLNFAVPNYTLMQQAILLSSGRVGEFQPDVVMIVSPFSELRPIADYVFKELQAGVSFPAGVDQVVRKAGVTGKMSAPEAMKKLAPYSEDLAEWAINQAAAEIKRMGAEPVYAIIPVPSKRNTQFKESRLMLTFARAAGFLTLDIADVFKTSDVAKLALSETDRQPNAEGHKIIARRVFEGLTKMPAVLAADNEAGAKRKAMVRAEWNREYLARKKADEASAAKLAKAAKPAVPPVPIEGWTVEAPDGGLANLESSRKDNWMRVSISRLPKSPSSRVKLLKAPVPIVNGHRYVLTLWTKADAARPFGCRLAQGAAPGGLLAESTELQANTWWQEFSCSFTATGTTPDAQIQLDFGTSDTALELSNIQLKDLSTGQVVMSTDPAWRRPARTPK